MSDPVLDAALRFHLILDEDGHVSHVGPSLAALLPDDAIGKTLYQLVGPTKTNVDVLAPPDERWCERLVYATFSEPEFTLRGEFIPYVGGSWLFAAALDPTDAERVGELGLTPTDFAPSDMTMDFSMLKWTRDSQIRETRLALLKLRRSISEGDELRRRVDTDQLTGIANRNRFLDVVEETMTASAESGTGLSVLMIDIDRFKTINDLHGHSVGDQVLVHIAAHLDWVIGDAGLVARLGADEFAVVVPADPGQPDRLSLDVDQLCADIVSVNHAPARLEGGVNVAVQLSIGVAFRKDEASAGELLRHADIAMHAARRSGGEAVAVFDPLAQHELELRRLLADELPQAIEDREIQLLFQPIVDLKTRRAVKFEVLSRWTHPIHGAIPPSLFFDVAEQCHMIHALDRYVIERALRVAAERLTERGEVPVLSVNVSALSLTGDLVTFIQSTLRDRHFPANRLCVEVTETSAITDLERTSRVLHDLDALGIVVSLDDFGTGFSSLTYLHQLPIGALKIDRSFVADMLTSRKALELVRSILNVASSLGLPVVAEGIETVEQCMLLSNLGCEQGQGYFFARPASAEAAAATIGRPLPFSSREVDPTAGADVEVLPSPALRLARDPNIA